MIITDTAASAPWKDRESARFAVGTYKPIPVNLSYPANHFAHLSTTETEADYVAYTPTNEYGEADRQVRLKFGRYLKKAFAETLTDAEIQAHVTTFKSALAIAEKPATLHFATDIPTINDIFETEMRACGSSAVSCMHGKFDRDAIRPYHVYANSPDVAVAYVRTAGAIVSRSVVSTKDKAWVRLYSVASGDNDTDCGTLKTLLTEAGYRKGELIGNRLTKLNTPEVMLPYIDNGGAHVIDAGKWWKICDEDSGDYEANCTDGTAEERGERCSVCNRREDDCECHVCECCNGRSRNGCDDCSMCEECDGCREHDGCNCARCSDCHEIISPRNRYTNSCECGRCVECNELTDDCECEKCEECGELERNCTCEETEDSEPAEDTDIPDILLVTPDDIRQKLNRIWVYLAYKRDVVDEDAKTIIKTAFDSIMVPTEVAA